MKVTLTRKNKAFHFEAINEADLILNIDGSPEIGGENKGFRPMELLLSGIASCSTIDLLLILKKQRQAVEDIKIEGTAERSTEAAKEFKKIHLHYIIEGEVVTDKMEHAIDLSINKYCSAIQSLSPAIEITTSFKIN
tara:strand:- start:11 stop:421 length:411 start_codon:yes stop_codon:yes gene_type:complete